MSAPVTWAIVPAKPFSQAKSRLAPSLGIEERRSMARRLLERTLTVLRESANLEHILLVSRDPDALAVATLLGAEGLEEEGEGLNEALTFAARHAVARGAERILVLHSDLPMLEAADIAALIDAGLTAEVVIAHDRHAVGTNALLSPPFAFPYAFGQQSFAAHMALASEAGYSPAVIARPGLALDVDYPGDLEALRVAGPEGWRRPGE